MRKSDRPSKANLFPYHTRDKSRLGWPDQPVTTLSPRAVVCPFAVANVQPARGRCAIHFRHAE
jgi:hypothetical protein